MKILNKTIEYGLYLLAFLLPWQTRLILRAGEISGGYWEYGTISLYLTDIFLLALIGLFFAFRFVEKKYPIPDNQSPIPGFWLVIAGLELIIFISVLLAPNKLLAVYGYMKFLLGVGLFWLVVGAKYERIKFLFSLFLGMAIQALIGIWQFLFQSSFASKWLGMAVHPAEELGTSVVEFGIERWLRAYGGFDHPNILGGVMVVGLLLIVALKIKNNFKVSEKNIWNDASFYSLLVIFSFALFFSFSRGAWIAFGAGILAIIFLSAVYREYACLKILEKILIVFLIVFLISSFLYKDLVTTRLFGETRLENKSNTERMASFRDAKNIIANNWLLGGGVGNYGLLLKESMPSTQPSYFYQPAHNVFLLIWSEIGVVGLILFLMIFQYLFRDGWRQKDFTTISILISIIIMMMVDHWWWSLHFGVLFFWLVVGLGYSKEETRI